jgi:hypothetical protein
MATEEFHSKNLRGVRQEVYAQLALVTLNRIFTNHTDDNHKVKNKLTTSNIKTLTNFKNSVCAFTRNIECLLIGTAQMLEQGLFNLLNTVARRYQKRPPNRSYLRVSRTPQSKWDSAACRSAARACKQRKVTFYYIRGLHRPLNRMPLGPVGAKSRRVKISAIDVAISPYRYGYFLLRNFAIIAKFHVMSRTKYNIEPIVVNDLLINEIVIDGHYKEKHGSYLDDQKILEIIRRLDGRKQLPDSVVDGFS